MEYADRVDALVQEEVWTGRDRAGVWVLNMGMALSGSVLGLPEVALETAWLALPDGDGVRRLPSDFAMGSPGVRRAIRGQVEALPARPDHPRALRPQEVRFPYDPSRESLRVALALNPVTLSGRAVPAGEGWRLELEARVPVRYPSRYLLVLFELDGRTIGIEEGLYGRLQDEGWLFPYEMVWTWSMDARDPRLGVDWGGGPLAEAALGGL